MEEAVREAFSRLRVDDADIFTEPIDRTLRVGLDKAADDFYTLIRYAMPSPKHEAASAAWRFEPAAGRAAGPRPTDGSPAGAVRPGQNR